MFAALRERGKDVADDRTRNECSSKREKWGYVEVKVILKSIFERLKALLQMGIRHIIHLNFFSFPAFLATDSPSLILSPSFLLCNEIFGGNAFICFGFQ